MVHYCERKIKVIKEYYDETLRTSNVVIATPKGHFSGTAKLHPYDDNTTLAGMNIAYERAMIKYLKQYKKEIDIKKRFLNNLLSNWETRKDYPDSKFLYIQLNELIEDSNTVKEDIEAREKSLKLYFEARDKVMKKIKDLADKKDKNK